MQARLYTKCSESVYILGDTRIKPCFDKAAKHGQAAQAKGKTGGIGNKKGQNKRFGLFVLVEWGRGQTLSRLKQEFESPRGH